jgi:hypothetical protein
MLELLVAYRLPHLHKSLGGRATKTESGDSDGRGFPACRQPIRVGNVVCVHASPATHRLPGHDFLREHVSVILFWRREGEAQFDYESDIDRIKPAQAAAHSQKLRPLSEETPPSPRRRLLRCHHPA